MLFPDFVEKFLPCIGLVLFDRSFDLSRCFVEKPVIVHETRTFDEIQRFFASFRADINNSIDFGRDVGLTFRPFRGMDFLAADKMPLTMKEFNPSMSVMTSLFGRS